MRSKTVTRTALFLAVLLMSLMRPEIAEMKTEPATGLRFSISFPETSSQQPLYGRILLLVSTDGSKEPRFQINEDLNTQQVFGRDVEALNAGQETILDSDAFGYPLATLSNLKPGDYWIQALLHRYELFHRADGHSVRLPMDRSACYNSGENIIALSCTVTTADATPTIAGVGLILNTEAGVTVASCYVECSAGSETVNPALNLPASSLKVGDRIWGVVSGECQGSHYFVEEELTIGNC